MPKQYYDLYEKTIKELSEREQSNSELYDRSILTLSTAALGISLAFINDTVSPVEARCLLIASWWLFGLAIISTILSFWASQIGLKIQRNNARELYLEGNKEHIKPSIPAKMTDCLNYCSGILFIAAVVSTIAFVSINT